MYRLDSVGLFGLPIRPFGWARATNQLTAFTRLSLYLPSRRVLPSMSMHIPPRAVMVVGYWPPWASQWPSAAWFRFSHSSPFSTIASASTFFFPPSGGAAPAGITAVSRLRVAHQIRRVAVIVAPRGGWKSRSHSYDAGPDQI